TDASSIRLAVEGTERVELTAEGDLLLHTAARDLRQPKPVLYQDSEGGRQTIDGGYVLGEQQEVRFWVGAYDPARPLTIDPVLVYSTYVGGLVGAGDGVNGIAVDVAGNAYITGSTFSPDFPTTPGAFQRTFHGGIGDAFVTKLNASGTALLYST